MLRFFRTRNLWVSAFNNGIGFLCWTIPSVLGVMLQTAHEADPSVYHFEGAGDSLNSGASADRRLSRSLVRLRSKQARKPRVAYPVTKRLLNHIFQL